MEISSNVLLPLNFYCRNARFCMKKAAFSKKACLASDELVHLKKFYTLVTVTIPSHPQFEAQKTEKQFVELHTYLPETRKRMQQLEVELFSSTTNTNSMVNTTKPGVKDRLRNVRGIKKTVNKAKALPLPSFSNDDPLPPPPPLQRQQQKQKRLGSKAISFMGTFKKPRKKQESPDYSSEDSKAAMAIFMNNHNRMTDHGNSCYAASAIAPRSSPSHNKRTSNVHGSSSPLVKHESNIKQLSIGYLANSTHNIASSMNVDHIHMVDQEVSQRQSNANIISDLDQRNLNEMNLLRPHRHRHKTTTIMSPSSSSAFNPQSPLIESDFKLQNHHIIHNKLEQDGHTDHTAASYMDRRNARTYYKNTRNGDDEVLFSESHCRGIENIESMQKEWVNSSQRRNSSSMQTDDYRLIETTTTQTNLESISKANVLRVNADESAGKDQNTVSSAATTAHIKTKLDEEYGKMRDQMKWLKRKDGFLQTESGNVISSKQTHADEKETSIGRTHSDITLIHGSTSILCGHRPRDRHSNDEVKSFYDEDIEDRQRDHVNSRLPNSSLLEEKLHDRSHTNNASASNNTKQTLSTSSPFHTSLPFSHYISKLKELSGRRDITSLPSINTACNMTQILDSKKQESPSRIHDRLHLSTSLRISRNRHNNQTVQESPDSSPHSDTFSEALTFSNPVFDLEGERLPQRISGLEDECQDYTYGGHGMSTEEVNDDKYQQDILSTSTLIHSPLATNRQGHKILHHAQIREVNHREALEENEFSIAGHQFRSAKNYLMKKFREKQENSIRNEEESLSTNQTHLPSYIDREGDELCGIQDNSNQSYVDPVQAGRVSFGKSSPPEISSETKAKATFTEHNTLDPNVFVFDRESSWLIHTKIEELQQELKDHKDQSMRETESIKGMINQDVRDKIDELVGTVQWAKDLLMVKENERQILEGKLGNCENQFKSLQQRMNVFQSELKILNEINDVSIYKLQMEEIEKIISKSVETFRSELALSMESVREDSEIRFERNRDALESLLLQKIDVHNRDCSPSITLSDDMRDAIAKIVQVEVHSVQEEIHQISVSKDELEQKIEKLTNVANDARECISQNNRVLSNELNRVRKEGLKSKRENKQTRQEVKGIKKSFEVSLTQMREEIQVDQMKGEELRRIEESLRKENLSHGILLGRIDELSHFCQCALEEMRGDLHHVKMVGQGRLEEMEYRWEGFVREQQHDAKQKCNSSLHDLAMDGLKSRIQAIEKTVDTFQDTEKARIDTVDLQKEIMKLQNLLVLVEKDRELASSAANEAMEAANRTERVLEELSKACEESCAHSSISKEYVNYEKVNEERIEELASAIAKVTQCTSELNEKHKEHEMFQNEIMTEVMNYERVNKERIEELASTIAKAMQNTSELDEKQKEHEIFLHEISKEGAARDVDQKGLVEKVFDAYEKINASLKRIEHLEKMKDHLLTRDEENGVSTENLAKLLNLYEEMSCFFKELKKMEGGDGGENKNNKNETRHYNEAAFSVLDMKVGELENRICHMETATTLTTRTLESKTQFFTAQIEIALTAAMKAEGKCSALGSELVKVFRALASSKRKRFSKPTQYEENNHHHNQTLVVRDPSYKKRTTKEQNIVGTKENAGFDKKLKEHANTLPNEALETNRSDSTTTTTTHTKTSMSNLSNLGTNLSTIETFTDPSSSYATQRSMHGHDHHDRSNVKMGRMFKLATDLHSHNKQASDDQYQSLPTKASTTIITSNTDHGRCNMMDAVKTQNDAKMMILEGKLPITEGKSGKTRIECARKERIRVGCASRDYQMTDVRMDEGRILVNVCHQSAFVSGTRSRVVTQGENFTVKTE